MSAGDSEETLALLDTILASAPIGLGFLDRELRYVRVNHALAEMNGMPPEAHIGRTVEELLPGLPVQVMEYLRTVLRAGEPVLNCEVSGTTPASLGHQRYWTASYYPVRTRSGEVRGVGVVVADITERKRAEQERMELMEQLREALRAREDFVTMASHDLKNPLTTLKLKLSSVLRSVQRGGDCVLSDHAMSKLQTADEQVDRMVRLINDLLDTARMGNGRIRLEPEHMDLVQLCQEVAERSRDELQHSGCALSLQAETQVCGYWDRMRLDQVVTNLLSNAIKYGAGKPIEMRVEADGERARFVVRDHGVGIAPADHVRIFERFERAGAKQRHGSFGLGLWIVRRILESFGGTIRVASELGAGATFTVEIPLTREPPRSALLR